MGSDASKKHETFSVSPAPQSVADDTSTAASAAAPAWAELDHTLSLISGWPTQSGGAGSYEQLVALVDQASQQLQAAGLEDSDATLYQKKIAAESAAALQALDAQALQALAAEQGFQYPQLVGMSGGEHPLAHWLNPAYPGQGPSKAKIQAKAIERFEQLASGAVDNINGVTLDDVAGADVAHVGDTWQASPAEFAMAIAAVADAASKFGAAGGDGGLTALLEAERRLHTADCPDMGAEAAVAKASVSAMVSQRLDSVYPGVRVQMIGAAAAAAVEAGTMPARHALWLDTPAQLAMLRATTPASVREELDQTALERDDQVLALTAAVNASKPELPASVDDIAPWALTKRQAVEAFEVIMPWQLHAAAAGRQKLAASGYATVGQMRETLSAKWRQWAKEQPLGALRKAAVDLGLTDAAAASRAQLQNYVAANWDPYVHADQVQAAVSAAAAVKATKAVASPSDAAGSSVSTHAAGATTPIAGSWSAKHAHLVATLQAHASLTREIPRPRPQADIEQMQLSAAKPASVGGMHKKAFHEDADGRLWLHKPDAQGARAHAESAAARLHNHVGVQTPPVYVRAVGGKLGSLQPWVAGAGTLSQAPSEWSQTDVDALVRFHVVAWACSNHDGNPNNILRTPSGALAPIDHGQAWRYFGKDRLSLDYDPNGSSYGQPPPAYLSAYRAALKGQLQKGVRIRPEAALPVIKAFEQMPDSAFKAELQAYAEAGAQSNLPWVATMRKSAQKRLGTTAVAPADIAEEFLLHAVARKASLRGSFAAFFSELGFDNKGLTKVA